ncbi:regulator of G-protein signaling protein-like [Ciona intestinalis]
MWAAMRYRTSRAFRLLMKSGDYDVINDMKYCDIISDDISDDEGGLPQAPVKVYTRFPQIDPTTIASYSAREYPKVGVDYAKYSVLRVIPKLHKLAQSPIYMKPVCKRGTVLKRPQERPKSFAEVLRDPVHLEFFKRFMKFHKSETPVLFWKTVELLKRTESSSARQKKAQLILKKFFGRLAGGGVMLQCDSDIIEEIAKFNTVTTSMLVQAQVEVVKSMERHWAQRYFKTFPPPPMPSPKVSQVLQDKREGIGGIKTKLRRIWELFSEIMRRAARFIAYMKDPRMFERFRRYLKRVPQQELNKIAGGDASNPDVNKRLQQSFDCDVTKMVCGRKVTLDYLADDLIFWVEADRWVQGNHPC